MHKTIRVSKSDAGDDGDDGGFPTTLPAWQGPRGYHGQGSNPILSPAQAYFNTFLIPPSLPPPTKQKKCILNLRIWENAPMAILNTPFSNFEILKICKIFIIPYSSYYEFTDMGKCSHGDSKHPIF